MTDQVLRRLQSQLNRLSDHPSGLLDLGRALVGPPEPEQRCDTCQDALPDYVEAELNGQPVRRLFPALTHHLDTCPVCGEMYVGLLEIILQAEEGPLSIPATAITPDLSFLPPLTAAERLRHLCAVLVEEVMRAWDPSFLPDLPQALQTFFRRLDEMGYVTLRPEAAQTLGFSSDTPPALQAVAAVYTATDQALRTLPLTDLEAELRSNRPPRTLEEQARSAARRVGLSRRQARQLARQYARLAQDHTVEILEIARAVPKAGAR